MAERKYKPGKLAIGPLSPNGIGAHYVQPRHTFPSSERVCNAQSSGTYTGERWNTRPGWDHSHLKSRGVRC